MMPRGRSAEGYLHVESGTLATCRFSSFVYPDLRAVPNASVGIERAKAHRRQAIDKTSAHLLLYGTKARPSLAQPGQGPSQEAGTRGCCHPVDLGRDGSYKKRDITSLLR